MGRKKEMRFEENMTRENVFQDNKEIYKNLKGNWNKDVFPSLQPIVLELACGYGEYSVGLGKVYPHKNFIGIDVKGDRIWKGSTEAIENNLTNVAFLRTQIQQLEDFFEEDEVDEVWIIHPDPRPRNRDIKRRLTAPRFLNMYQNIMKAKGRVHLKTDNDGLFDYTLEVLKEYPSHVIEQTRDLRASPLAASHHGIETRYEKRALGQGLKINYLSFEFA